MHLRKLKMRNRRLANVQINLDSEILIFVGANNSNKLLSHTLCISLSADPEAVLIFMTYAHTDEATSKPLRRDKGTSHFLRCRVIFGWGRTSGPSSRH